MYSGSKGPLLELEGEGVAADLDSVQTGILHTDLLCLARYVRNEAAVAFLALGNLEAYRYNNNAYTALYKQISEDTSLEQYCRHMHLLPIIDSGYHSLCGYFVGIAGGILYSVFPPPFDLSL